MTKKKTLKTDPTQSATCATESSPKPNIENPPANTAEAPKAQSSNGTPQGLSDQQRQELAGLAQMLGIPQLAEQVSKLTEVVNSLMGVNSKPSSALPAGGGQMLQGLMPIIQQALPAIIGAFTGGQQQETGGIDKEIMQQLAGDYKETLRSTNEAAKLLINEIRAGKTVIRNQETGDLVITTRQLPKT